VKVCGTTGSRDYLKLHGNDWKRYWRPRLPPIGWERSRGPRPTAQDIDDLIGHVE
jgi:hypothetical protein